MKLNTVIAIALAASMAVSAQAKDIEMQSIFPGTLPLLGEGAISLGETVGTLTDGSLNINFNNPGELVGASGLWDAVSTGAVDAGWMAPGFAEGVVPSAALFTAFPFGPDAREYTAWWYNGGGAELWAEVTSGFNVHTELCTILAPEASGWFREEITDIAQLEGKKMRIFGMGAAVMQKLGVAAQSMSPADTFSALNLGTIDAAEFSFPAIDYAVGMHEHAKHYYFPGWHQQSSLITFIINKDVWNDLSDKERLAISQSCKGLVASTIAEGEAIQREPLAKMQAENGVTIHRWSDEILGQFQGAWTEVIAEKTAQNDELKKVWDHISAFRDGYAEWSGLGYVD